MTSVAARPTPPENAKNKRLRVILYWVISAPVLLETAVGIQWDLARIPYVVDILARLGFPAYFATILGISKILALIAVLIPRTPRLKEWAYAGLTFVYVGAAACHIAIGDTIAAVATPLVLAAITLASWALRPATRRDPAPLPTTWQRTQRTSRTPSVSATCHTRESGRDRRPARTATGALGRPGPRGHQSDIRRPPTLTLDEEFL